MMGGSQGDLDALLDGELCHSSLPCRTWPDTGLNACSMYLDSASILSCVPVQMP